MAIHEGHRRYIKWLKLQCQHNIEDRDVQPEKLNRKVLDFGGGFLQFSVHFDAFKDSWLKLQCQHNIEDRDVYPEKFNREVLDFEEGFLQFPVHLNAF